MMAGESTLSKASGARHRRPRCRNTWIGPRRRSRYVASAIDLGTEGRRSLVGLFLLGAGRGAHAQAPGPPPGEGEGPEQQPRRDARWAEEAVGRDDRRGI